MAISLEYGGDFQLNQNGGLQSATGWTGVRQRLTRAFLTNPLTNNVGQGPLPPDYIYHPNYGTGAQRDIGEHVTNAQLSAIVAKLQQSAAQDPAVDQSVPVQVSVNQNAFQQISLSAYVTLQDKTSGTVLFTVQ
jgi:hypothetical protein